MGLHLVGETIDAKRACQRAKAGELTAGTESYIHLPVVEWCCLHLGRAAGFEVPDAALVDMPDDMSPALLVERSIYAVTQAIVACWRWPWRWRRPPLGFGCR